VSGWSSSSTTKVVLVDVDPELVVGLEEVVPLELEVST